MPKTAVRHRPTAPSASAAELCSLIVRSGRLVWAVAGARLSLSGESMHVFQVLARLVREGPLTQGALAEAIGQHPAGVSRLVGELEGEGLVRRHRDQHDRRKIRVEVTRRGRSRFELAYPEAIDGVGGRLRVLTETEQRALRDLLRKLLAEPSTKLPGNLLRKARKVEE